MPAHSVKKAEESGIAPILARISQPSPEDVKLAREGAGLSQGAAAQLVSPALAKPYRAWQGYEAAVGSKDHRTIPLAVWELFLLLTEQHPTYQLQARHAPKSMKLA